jgi:CubicO group peptidase (beta-lactamase class C family)
VILVLGIWPAFVGANECLAQSDEEPPLRVAESVSDVVADLEGYVGDRMRRDDVPGLAVALVRDGRMVWSRGFGVANVWTREPVTPDSVFEIASNSKVITAYVALRLVERGELALDEPLASYLHKPWLPRGGPGKRITLRQVASHSSGLTDQLMPLSREVVFEPGSQYLYSGVGYLYLQEAIEQVSGMPLDRAAQRLVFEPLGMSSTDFVNTPAIETHLVNGHIGFRIPQLMFLVPFVLLAVVVIALGVPVQRLAAGRWKPGAILVVVALVVSLVGTSVMLALRVGSALPNLALLAVICGAAFVAAFIGLTWVGLRRIGSRGGTARSRFLAKGLWTVVCLIVPWWSSGLLVVPVPTHLSPQPSAVGSVRSSAEDLARFLIELAEPNHLGAELASELRTSQTPINEAFSWSLGPGIQHSGQGDALWQMGITPGFRSVMVVYPEHRMGVVVLTNGDGGLAVAYDVAARALGGRAEWAGF